MAQHLAERLSSQAARRDDSWVARQVYRKPGVDGLYQLDGGALLGDFFSCLHTLGVINLHGADQSTAIRREIVPCVHYPLLYSLKNLFGIERKHTLPDQLFSNEAHMRMVGFNTQQVGHGVCYLGVAQRQGLRTRGPIGLDALADNIVTLNVRDLEAWFKGGIQALTKIGVWSPR